MILSEITGIVDGQSALEAAEFIKTNCQPFLKEWGSIPTPTYAMFRGQYNEWPEYIHHTLADREPTGMSKTIQKELDSFFKMEFGYKYRSDHIVFVTGRSANAEQFGNPCVIFPIGRFSYLWCPEIYDINYTLLNNISVDDIIQNYTFMHNKGITRANNHEVMIRVKSYCAIPLRVYKRSVYPLLIK